MTKDNTTPYDEVYILSETEALSTHIRSFLNPPGTGLLAPHTLDPLLEAQSLVRQTQTLLEETQREVHHMRTRAKEHGYADGMREATAALVSAHATYNDLLRSAEHDIACLALTICQNILGARFETHKELLQDSILHTLQHAQGARSIKLHVHPKNLALTQEAQERFQHSLHNVPFTITSDPRVHPQGCQIHTESGVIESDLSMQLTLFADAMGVSWSPN